MNQSPISTLRTDNPADVMNHLRGLGALPDGKIDLAGTALLLAALDQPGITLDQYESHLRRLSDDVRDRFVALIDAGADDTPETKIAALKHIICDQYGYDGDRDDYDDLQNASLIRTIDRRRGMPITLAILCIEAGRRIGWSVQGLNIPGHFVCRMDDGALRVIFDPFNGCKILQAPDLRQLVKQTLGPNAELSADYYNPADNRTILVRLQNNIKLRRIEAEDYEGALHAVEAMRAFDPNEVRLLLDAGVLYARTGRLNDAVAALEAYIPRAPSPQDRQDAEMLLFQVRDILN